MASSGAKPPLPIPPAAPAAPAVEAFRTKSIATRVTEAEFGEVESAAASAGQKVAEWLRYAALSQARAKLSQDTDPILLAEIVGMRALMLNLCQGFRGTIEQGRPAQDLRVCRSHQGTKARGSPGPKKAEGLSNAGEFAVR